MRVCIYVHVIEKGPRQLNGNYQIDLSHMYMSGFLTALI